jgi:lipopolysaccharide/colanic/teichoic acid biosynthesis glycosyltransferase
VYEVAKRIVDVVVAAVGLVLAAPLLVGAALAIRLGDRGPVLFRQVRVGHHGRHFSILKLRTMRVDAEPGGAVWADADDPRCTPIGRVLRRTRLDELPQLLNVLRGDMSFVGPRPERPEFLGRLEREVPYYAWRLVARPGLTGWAQINHPYGSSVDDARRKLEFDLYYVSRRSLLFDLVIALRTVTAALQGGR